MKKLSIILLCILPLMLMAEEKVVKIAVLETVDKAGNVEYGKRLFVRSTLTQAIAGTPGYEAYDRVDISAIMSEQDFQRTGNVSEDQIKKLGQMTGAKYVVLPEIAKMDAQTFYITAKILDVETGRAVSASGATSTTEVFSMKEACIQMANELLMLPSQRQAKQEKQVKEQKKEIVRQGHIDEFGWEYRDGKYYQNGYPVGRAEVDKKAIESMRINDQFAYNHYMSHDKKLITAGYALLPTGLAAAGLGAGLLVYAEEGVGDGPNWAAPFASGIAFLGVGGAAMVASVPCLVIGYKRKHATVNNYLLGTTNKPNYASNMPNADGQPYVTMRLNYTGNGLGMAVNF